MRRLDDDILDGLNPAQRDAVLHRDGPLFILAGAGSGKTRVITHRIAWLLREAATPQEVLAITFTNKAAGEMRERTERLTGTRGEWITTFHSFGARMLRRWAYRIEPYDTSFTILDMDDAKSLVADLLRDLRIPSEIWQPGSILQAISRVKSSHRGDPDALGTDFRHGRLLRSAYLEYVKRMQERNLVDFDDLLLLLVRLLEEHPDVLELARRQFRYVLVDEYQDTNALQYRICRLITAEHENLCITGDPDQSIYKWRGADIRNILEFERDYPKAHVIRLEQNYRSTRNILHIANGLIAHNVERKPKELWTEGEDGEPVRVFRSADEHHEAARIAGIIDTLLSEGASLGDIAVFYRLNSLSRVIEQELIYRNIPYTIVGGLEFFLRKEVKDVLAWARILDNPRDSESLKRVINVPPRGIGKGTIATLEGIAASSGRGLLETVLDPSVLGELQKKRASAIETFANLYRRLESLKSAPVETLVTAILEETGYREHWQASLEQDAQDRLLNLDELVNAAQEFDRSETDGGLRGFLELTAILGDVDRWERREDRVALMTIHAAKGLEFPYVFILGCEDGILPLVRADTDSVDLEEERRLLFVGITRAKKELYISHSARRSRFGRPSIAFPSRFLRELEPAAPTAGDAFKRLAMDLETERGLYEPSKTDSWDDVDQSDPWSVSEAPRTRSTRSRKRREIDEYSQVGPSDDTYAQEIPPDDDRFETDEDPFPRGSRVRHLEYGEGEVLRTSGFGRLRRVTIRFDEVGEKQFLAAYVALERIL